MARKMTSNIFDKINVTTGFEIKVTSKNKKNIQKIKLASDLIDNMYKRSRKEDLDNMLNNF